MGFWWIVGVYNLSCTRAKCVLQNTSSARYSIESELCHQAGLRDSANCILIRIIWELSLNIDFLGPFPEVLIYDGLGNLNIFRKVWG